MLSGVVATAYGEVLWPKSTQNENKARMADYTYAPM